VTSFQQSESVCALQDGIIHASSVAFERGVGCAYNFNRYSSDKCSWQMPLNNIDRRNTPLLTAPEHDAGAAWSDVTPDSKGNQYA
jgi:hypothetical protein